MLLQHGSVHMSVPDDFELQNLRRKFVGILQGLGEVNPLLENECADFFLRSNAVNP